MRPRGKMGLTPLVYSIQVLSFFKSKKGSAKFVSMHQSRRVSVDCYWSVQRSGFQIVIGQCSREWILIGQCSREQILTGQSALWPCPETPLSPLLIGAKALHASEIIGLLHYCSSSTLSPDWLPRGICTKLLIQISSLQVSTRDQGLARLVVSAACRHAYDSPLASSE